MDGQFTILVGSRARGTADLYSDVDIVRVGHKHVVTRKQLRMLAKIGAPIAYVDYDAATFKSLHESGSLFIHHILTEGKLLAGDAVRWGMLVKTFSVKKDLRPEINEQLRLCKWLLKPEAFSHATMPLL